MATRRTREQETGAPMAAADEQTAVDSAENPNESGSGFTGASDAVPTIFTSTGAGATSTPATTIEGVTTTEEEPPVILFYDGDTPSANFPVQAKDGSWIYVHAEKGQNTNALPADIAKKLLAGGKGFKIAASDERAS